MALCEVRFFSLSVCLQHTMHVIVPDGPGPFPVLYLLHGLSDDSSIWCRRTSIERYVDGLPLMVVMPDTHRFFYVNDPRPGGLAYENHIVRDVVGFVDRVFPTVRRRRGRAVAGLSMGGYGALMLAMRHPEMFCAAVSHSGATHFVHQPKLKLPDADALVAALPSAGYDLFELARRCKRSRPRPALRLDCGTEDHLIQFNRQFHEHLVKLGIGHQYVEHPGGHDWAYWDLHVRETIDFVLKHVRAGR